MHNMQELRKYFYTLCFTFKPELQTENLIWSLLGEMNSAWEDVDKRARLLKRLHLIRDTIDSKAKASPQAPIPAKRPFSEMKQWIDHSLWEVAEAEGWQVADPAATPMHPLDNPPKKRR